MGCPSKEEDIKIKKRPRVSTDSFTDIYMFTFNQVSTVTRVPADTLTMTFDNKNTNGWRDFVHGTFESHIKICLNMEYLS